MKKSKYHSNHRDAMNTYYLNSSTHGKDIFIMKAKVLQAFRKTNNTIYGYRIQDEYGRIKDVGPVTLKNAIKDGAIQLIGSY